jgi:hypothetical protein
MYVPNSDGSMNANLYQDLREWDSRDYLDLQRKEAMIASVERTRVAHGETADIHSDITTSDYSV